MHATVMPGVVGKILNTVFLFQKYTQISPERFDHLLKLAEPLISKQVPNFQKPISAGKRLSITLQFLATGESQQSCHFNIVWENLQYQM